MYEEKQVFEKKNPNHS